MFISRHSCNLIIYHVICCLLFILTNVILQYDVTCPDLVELQCQASPSTLTEEKRVSIINVIR